MYIFYFVVGFLIPVIASRFGKIIAENPGAMLYQLWHKPCFPKPKDKKRIRQLKQKWKKLFYFSFFWGVIFPCLMYVFIQRIGSNYTLFIFLYLWIITLLIAIDQQYFLLPDFFTIPLLLLGFCFSYTTNLIPMQEALLGSFYGYALAFFSVFFISFFKNAEFGGGDVKMMAALGAWLGFEGFNIAIFISFLIFLLYTLPFHKKQGAYGPALGLGALIAFLYNYSFSHNLW